MNKLFLSASLAAALLFTGCSKSTAFDFFSTDEYYENAIGNMKKASMTKDGETKALIQGVYLNKVDSLIYSGDEYFFVAIHIIDDEQDQEMQGLANVKYNLQLETKVKITQDDESKKPQYNNSNKSTSIKKTSQIKTVYEDYVELQELDDPTHKLRESMPIKSQWNHFYLIRFKEVKTPTITLAFESEQYGKVKMQFQKEEIFKNRANMFKTIKSQQKNY